MRLSEIRDRNGLLGLGVSVVNGEATRLHTFDVGRDFRLSETCLMIKSKTSDGRLSNRIVRSVMTVESEKDEALWRLRLRVKSALASGLC